MWLRVYRFAVVSLLVAGLAVGVLVIQRLDAVAGAFDGVASAVDGLDARLVDLDGDVNSARETLDTSLICLEDLLTQARGGFTDTFQAPTC